MLNKNRITTQIAAAVIAIGHLACQAHAAVTFFNDRTTFISTVNPTSSTDFSGAGADVNIDRRVSTDVGLLNVFYSTAGSVNQTLNTLQPTSSRLRLTVDDNTPPTLQTTEMTFQFSTPVTAFGFSIRHSHQQHFHGKYALTTEGDLVYFTEAFVAVPEPSSTLTLSWHACWEVCFLPKEDDQRRPARAKIEALILVESQGIQS